MSYFNHAFKKTMLGDKDFVKKAEGKLGTTGNTLAKGEFAFVDKDWKIQDVGSTSAPCCPLTLVTGSLMAKDKIGAFHGGYLETNKSKTINPRYVHKFYRVDPCTAQNHVIALGYTPDTIGLLVGQALTITNNGTGGTGAGSGGFTNGTYTNVPITGASGARSALATVVVASTVITSVTITTAGQGYGLPTGTLAYTILDSDMTGAAASGTAGGTYTAAMTSIVKDCCQDFLCDETYSLRVDVKGEAALELLAHNAYLTVEAYTGCCADPTVAPVAVDGTLVYIEWAKQLTTSPIMKDFLQIVVTDEANKLWYADGVDTSGLSAPTGFTIGGNWKDYVSPGHTTNECAGMSIQACYVSTDFGDCTFQYIDGYNYQPLKIYASEVDYTGSPCDFTGTCVVEVCPPVSPMGLGESVVRDLILSQSYEQNHLSTDLRIREITQGDDLLKGEGGASIRATDSWTRYQILHTVPRYNNPSGVFDNDQYLVELITDEPHTNFQDFVNAWLAACGNCDVVMETISCQTATCSLETTFQTCSVYRA
jgi:hypothetical protein